MARDGMVLLLDTFGDSIAPEPSEVGKPVTSMGEEGSEVLTVK